MLGIMRVSAEFGPFARDQLVHRLSVVAGDCGLSTNCCAESSGRHNQTSSIANDGSGATSSSIVAWLGSTCRNTAFQPAFRSSVCVSHCARAVPRGSISISISFRLRGSGSISVRLCGISPLALNPEPWH